LEEQMAELRCDWAYSWRKFPKSRDAFPLHTGSESVGKNHDEHIVATGNESGRPTAESHHYDVAFFTTMQRSLAAELQKRVVFVTYVIASPIQEAVAIARKGLVQTLRNRGDILVLGRNRTTDPVAFDACLRDAEDVILAAGFMASVLVVQDRGSGLDWFWKSM